MQHRATARGFTLIELMTVVAIGSIVGASFFGVMFMQNLSYLERLDELDAHQDARAALTVIRRYVQSARWGLSEDPNAAGTFVPLGKCSNPTAPIQSTGACNNLASDNGADRMRIIALVGDGFFVGNQPYGANVTDCTGNAGSDLAHIHSNLTPTSPLVGGTTLGGIGGACYPRGSANPSAATDVVIITGDAGVQGTCQHRYSFNILGGGSTLSCPNGYDTNFGFGRATVADFYIQVVNGIPQLMLSTNASQTTPNIVAFDVEDMQVQYGIDTSSPIDRYVDIWCDDPRITADGGNGQCDKSPTGTPLTTQGNYNRIMAVRVSLRVRTDSTRPYIVPIPLSNTSLSMTNNPVANQNDGYRRWVYTTTIALRNNNIQ